MSSEPSDRQQAASLVDRREAIKRVSALFGGVALVGGSALWTACAPDRSPEQAAGTNASTFTDTDIALLDEIADTILPETEKSPGAKSAKVGAFIALMVTDCYSPADQQIVRDGLGTLDTACRAAHGAPFVSATPAQRLALLEGIDREAHDYMRSKAPEAPTHYFRMLKELSMLGYFTSEIGATKALRYIEAPGRFDPCAPYVAGEPIWANHA